MVTNSTPTDVGYTTISNVRAIFYVEDVFTLEDNTNSKIFNAGQKIVENSTLRHGRWCDGISVRLLFVRVERTVFEHRKILYEV